MPDMTAIALALNSFKVLKDIAQAMIGLRDAQAFQTKLIEFNSALIDAQTSVFAVNQERAALVERVHDLEAKITEMEDWKAKEKRYELKETAPRNFAYMLKPNAQGTEPPHWICPNCYAKRQYSILQGIESAYSGWSHKCYSCELEIRGSL